MVSRELSLSCDQAGQREEIADERMRADVARGGWFRTEAGEICWDVGHDSLAEGRDSNFP